MPGIGLEICEIFRIFRNKQFCMDGETKVLKITYLQLSMDFVRHLLVIRLQ